MVLNTHKNKGLEFENKFLNVVVEEMQLGSTKLCNEQVCSFAVRYANYGELLKYIVAQGVKELVGVVVLV
jgi:hypothetical protein